MNEEKLKRDLNKELCFDENMVGYKVMNNYIDKAIKIGKLKQKKEEFGDFIKWLDWLINSPKNTWSKQIKIKLEQLQKEIGDNSQTENEVLIAENSISDKEVAQPYSKSDKTTKEIRRTQEYDIK